MKKGMGPSEILKNLQEVYEDSSPSYKVVKTWSKQFQFGKEKLKDLPHTKDLYQ